MKIGVLTQPLHDNYGGLLQAYALKEVLRKLGHDVVIINREKPMPKKWRLIASKVKSFLHGQRSYRKQYLSISQRKIISKNTNKFREEYIPEQSKLIISNSKMKSLNKDNFKAIIVGSDQCWRPIYSPKIENYFLDFIDNIYKIKRISYAASFGTSDWEFSAKQTRKCKKLLENFDAVSVREKSGINLVRDHLGRNDATHVLDPTMLLYKVDYEEMIEQENLHESKGDLKVYILDQTREKNELVKRIEKHLNLNAFEVMPKSRVHGNLVNNTNIRDFQYPNPIQWIKGFKDAKFVVTDSFHGTVFSIIFNVPFIAIGNKNRGIARFQSILEILDLSDRLVVNLNDLDLENLLNKDINWEAINENLESRRVESLYFLKKNI